jgi:hypothetical protein
MAFSTLALAALFICAQFCLGAKAGADFGLEVAAAFFFLGTYAVRRDKQAIIETTPLRLVIVLSGLSSLGAFGVYFAK